MSIPCKFERSVLSFEEHQLVARSHHPEIYESGVDDLKALRQQLRDLRNKTRTLALARRREVRGKGPSRGAGFPGTAEHTLQRKQVFSAALKRVNREIDRMEKVEARAVHMKARRRPWPCAAPRNSLTRRRSPTHRTKACVRCRVESGAPGLAGENREHFASDKECAGGAGHENVRRRAPLHVWCSLRA